MKRKETVDIVDELVTSLVSKVAIDSIVVNGDNTYTITTENTSYLFPNMSFDIAGTPYKVLNTTTYPFDYNSKFTIEGLVDITGTLEIVLNPLHYFHGTAIETVGELSRINISTDKFPMVYLLETVDDDFNNDDNLRLDRTSNLRLFFLSETDENQWDTDQHYKYSIIPMRNVVYSFIEHLESIALIAELGKFNAINHAKFGVNVSEQGHTKRIFKDQLSGVELRINLPILKAKCNSSDMFKPVIPVCLPVSVTDNGTVTEVVSGGDYTCTAIIPIPDTLYNPTKTGVPSFISEDDGQTQAGRLVNFYTLDFTNPYGNTTRFTNDLGGLFNDNSDGSTADYVVDNATKIGYRLSWDINRIFADHLAHALTMTIGAYGGFRMVNLNEHQTIMDSIGTNWWTQPDQGIWSGAPSGTAYINRTFSSTLACRFFRNTGILTVGITTSASAMFCRNHTY